jgi:hypothetical protein
MKLIMLRSVIICLLTLLFSIVHANHSNIPHAPIVSCEKKGIPHYSSKRDVLVCMLNNTRCCIIRLEFDNGLTQWASELDTETVYFSAISSLGTDEEGNESFSVTPIE